MVLQVMSVKVDKKTIELLDKWSRELGVSRGELVRRAVADYMLKLAMTYPDVAQKLRVRKTIEVVEA